MRMFCLRMKKRMRTCAALFLALCISTGQLSAMAGEDGGGRKETLPESITDAITHIYPFDGDASDWVQDDVSGEALGNLSYEEGKFGQAVCLDGGSGIK